MSDRDVDAQFADIIAHWDDVAPLPERGPDAPQTNDSPTAAGPDVLEATDGDPRSPTEDRAGGGTDGPGSGAPQRRPGTVNPSPLNPAVNPPPMLGGIPVWRGATSDAGPMDTGADRPPRAGADDDEHFEPGPTAPLPPQEDLHFWGIVVGLVAGPLILLWLVIFRPEDSGWWVLGALALTIGGFVLLVLRQPHSRDEDDPDNGARV
jgi:hypothetical protein